MLCDFFEREINLHLDLERIKADLTSRHDWNLRDVFQSIDTTQDGFLNHRNILSFLRINGYYATDEEIIAIVRRLDEDADQRINFSEFALSFEYPTPIFMAGA